jgi:hypothetical protein
MSTEAPFTAEELRETARRAFVLAKDADSPAMRIALGLFGESAENLAKRIPQAPVEPAESPAESVS